jgi:hypothetical protein
MANTSKLIKPKWELYDLKNNIEHELFEDYIVEFTDIAGIKIEYYIRDESIEMDTLYGESVNTKYLSGIESKLLYEPTAEPTLTTGFGINTDESIQYASMPKFMFSRDISAGYNPKPGDVIKTLWNNRTYEIVDVHEEERIFQLKKMSWGFVLKSFRFSEQSISSKGISVDIDSTLTNALSAYGDNEYIENKSDENINYDNSIYGH